MTIPVEGILLIPVAAALLSAVSPNSRTASAVSIMGSAAVLAVSIPICMAAFGGTVTEYGLWYVDGLSSVFILIIGVVGLMSSMYSYGYLSHDEEHGEIGSKDIRQYHIMFNMFIAAMLSIFVVS